MPMVLYLTRHQRESLLLGVLESRDRDPACTFLQYSSSFLPLLPPATLAVHGARSASHRVLFELCTAKSFKKYECHGSMHVFLSCFKVKDFEIRCGARI